MLDEIRLASIDDESAHHNTIYSIWGIAVLRRLSYIPSLIFVRYEVSPNQITLISLIVGIVGWIKFTEFGYNNCLVGAILLNIWGVLDCSDGTVARITNTSSDFGARFEAIVGGVIVSGLFIFVGFAEGLLFFGIICFIFQIISRLFFTLDFADDINFFTYDIVGIKDYLMLIGYNLNNGTGIIGVLLIFALLGILDLFVLLYVILSLITLIVSIIMKVRMKK